MSTILDLLVYYMTNFCENRHTSSYNEHEYSSHRMSYKRSELAPNASRLGKSDKPISCVQMMESIRILCHDEIDNGFCGRTVHALINIKSHYLVCIQSVSFDYHFTRLCLLVTTIISSLRKTSLKSDYKKLQ